MEQFNEQEQQLRVDLKSTLPVLCECGNNTFQEVSMIRKVSRFSHPGLPMDQFLPISLMACIKCGEIHKDSLPPMIKALLENETENN